MNIWITEKNLVKHYYQKKMILYSEINMEDITDADYMHAKRVCKDFEIKNVGEYYDLYLKVIHYFWLMLLKILEKCV